MDIFSKNKKWKFFQKIKMEIFSKNKNGKKNGNKKWKFFLY